MSTSSPSVLSRWRGWKISGMGHQIRPRQENDAHFGGRVLRSISRSHCGRMGARCSFPSHACSECYVCTPGSTSRGRPEELSRGYKKDVTEIRASSPMFNGTVSPAQLVLEHLWHQWQNRRNNVTHLDYTCQSSPFLPPDNLPLQRSTSRSQKKETILSIPPPLSRDQPSIMEPLQDFGQGSWNT